MAVISAAQAGSKNVVAFLDLIGFSEGTSTEDITKNQGYDVIVTGEDHLGSQIHEEVFTDYSNHPFASGRPPQILREKPLLESTASGRYQLLARYWPVYKTQLHLSDFSPLSQDLVAIQQIREHRDANHITALTHLINGDIQSAINLCSGTWASLPGNDYGQGGKSMGVLVAKWNEFLEAAQ